MKPGNFDFRAERVCVGSVGLLALMGCGASGSGEGNSGGGDANNDTNPWPRFNRLLDRYPLPRAVVIDSVCRRAANP